MIGRTGGRPDRRADMFGILDTKAANPTGAGMDQNRFSGFDLRIIVE